MGGSWEGTGGAGVAGLGWEAGMTGDRWGIGGVVDDGGRGGRGISARPTLDLASVGRGGSGMSGRGVPPEKRRRREREHVKYISPTYCHGS